MASHSRTTCTTNESIFTHYLVWKYLRIGFGVFAVLGFFLGLAIYNYNIYAPHIIITQYHQQTVTDNHKTREIIGKYDNLTKTKLQPPATDLDNKEFVIINAADLDNPRNHKNADLDNPRNESIHTDQHVQSNTNLNLRDSIKPKLSAKVRRNMKNKRKKQSISSHDKQVAVSKSTMKKPAHVVDSHIWEQMVKYYPIVLKTFMKDFLPGYKNPCFRRGGGGKGGGGVKCLPYFYLVGTPKSASTDLWYNILRHPQVVKVRKEPHFWKSVPKTDRGTAAYLNNFKRLPLQAIKTSTQQQLIIGDGSASTLWANNDIARKTNTITQGEIPFVWADVIQAILPNEKIIAILRNPTNRTISGYFAFPSFERSPEDFHRRIVDAIREFKSCLNTRSLRTCVNVKSHNSFPRIWTSIYVAHLREWLRLYPRKQLMILRTEDWHYHKARNHLQKVFQFLDIEPLSESELPALLDKRELKDLKIKQVTTRGTLKYGEIFPKTRELLNRFYEPYNKQLAELLNDNRFLWKDV